MFSRKKFVIKILISVIIIDVLIIIFGYFKDIAFSALPVWLSYTLTVIFASLITIVVSYIIFSRFLKQLQKKELYTEQMEELAKERAFMLSNEEEKYSAIVKAFDGLIYICSQDYIVEFMNENFIKRTGYNGIGDHCYKALHDLDDVCSWCVNDRVFKGETVKWEVKSPKDNHWFYVVNTPINHPDGTISKMSMILDITEQKELNLKLEESEKVKSAILESLQELIVYQNLDNEIIWVNKAAAETVNLAPEQLVGQKCYEIWNNRGKPCKGCPVLKSLETNRPETNVMTTPDGRIWSISGYPVRDNDNNIIAVVESALDITEKKLSEKKIQKSEAKYRKAYEEREELENIINKSPAVVFLWQNKEGWPVEYVSDNVSQFGYSPEDFYTQQVIFAEIIHPEDLDRISSEVSQHSQEDLNEFTQEYRIITKNGDTRWLDDRTWIRRDIEGLITHYHGIVVDITEQKKFEEALKESEEKFRSIAEQSAMGIMIAQYGQFKFVNKAMERINGYPIETMQSWNLKDFSKLVHKDDIEKVIEIYKKHMRGEYHTYNDLSLRVFNSDNKERWIELFINEISYQGQTASLISIVDISEKKKVEELIIKENEKLNELNKIREELITRVSHELKTPLTSIYGSIQYLLENYKDELNPGVKNYIDLSHMGCIRLKALIDNLLDISRSEANKFKITLQEENLASIIKENINELTYLAESRELDIDIDLNNRINYSVDRIRFGQAITNLFSNAIKNTPKGGKIWVSMNRNNGVISISIKDSGVGITKEEEDKLFQKFGKVERYGKNLDVDIEGTGLGLYISKQIIEKHGGEINVESEGRNKGATFIINLFEK